MTNLLRLGYGHVSWLLLEFEKAVWKVPAVCLRDSLERLIPCADYIGCKAKQNLYLMHILSYIFVVWMTSYKIWFFKTCISTSLDGRIILIKYDNCSPLFYPPQTKFFFFWLGGGYIGITMSVHLSVCLSITSGKHNSL